MPQFSAANPIGVTLAGARQASAIERSGFGLVGSYGITLGVARAVSYIHDERRPASAKRRLRRRVNDTLSHGGHLRVHHYVPGIAIAFTSGAAAILRSRDDRAFCLSLLFGTGVGLTLDEILVLLERSTSYRGHQNVAVAQCAAAAVAAAALGVRFHQQGSRLICEESERSSSETDRSSGRGQSGAQ